MYRRPKFLEVLLEIRQEMAREADYDVDLFAEMVRAGKSFDKSKVYALSEPPSNHEKTKNGLNSKPAAANRK